MRFLLKKKAAIEIRKTKSKFKNNKRLYLVLVI